MQQCIRLLRGSAFPSPRVTRWIPMTAITKPQLQAQLDEALERIAELEAAQAEALAQEAAQAETRIESNRLEQTIWLQKNSPSKEWSRGITQGNKPFIRFGAQFSRLDKTTGERRFGAWKNYVAYGDVASQLEAAFAGTDRLAHMVAFEQPSHGAGNERYTEWVVTEFALVPRIERIEPAATPEPAQGPAVEPSLEELPF